MIKRFVCSPMGGTIGKNLPKLPKWDDAAWKREKKKNTETISKPSKNIWRDWSQ